MSRLDDRSMESLTRSFLLGTGRNPAPIQDAFKDLVPTGGSLSELAALALLGQRMRFRRHGPPPPDSTGAVVDDPRTIVPDAVRPLMRRLVGGPEGSASDVAALALADVCNRRRIRPHPFDVPRLAAFVKAHADLLGAYAADWAAHGGEADKKPGSYFEADAIDATNWTSARPAARADFIAAMRMREPDRARELVEASFATDAAPVRARLLAALRCGLSAADVPFLESLAKDRAPSIREEAQRLLRYIPDTAAADGRLHDLVARTQVSTAGLLRRRKTLALERPANLPTSPHVPGVDPARRWAVEEYAGLGLDAMAAAFALSVPDMITAAGDDPAFMALFARQASIEGRFDVLAAIVRDHAADAWTDAMGTGNEAELRDDATVEQWCAAALAPQLWSSLPPPVQLESLYRFLRRPLPQAQARELLQSRAFASMDSEALPSGMLAASCLALGALVPSALRQELRTALLTRPPEDMARAILLLDCLLLLDPPHP